MTIAPGSAVVSPPDIAYSLMISDTANPSTVAFNHGNSCVVVLPAPGGSPGSKNGEYPDPTTMVPLGTGWLYCGLSLSPPYSSVTVMTYCSLDGLMMRYGAQNGPTQYARSIKLLLQLHSPMDAAVFSPLPFVSRCRSDRV